MGTIIVGIIIIAVVALAVRSILRDRKSGKSCHCGGNCGSCGMNCHKE